MQEEYADLRAGDRLRVSIEARSDSLAAFARFSGIPYRSLQDYIAGKSKPGFDQLAKLASAGLDLSYILTGYPTSSIDHPSPSTIEMLHIDERRAIVGRHFLKHHIDKIPTSAVSGLDVREWLNIWTAAEGEVGPADDGAKDLKRHQAVVFAVAAAIAQGGAERLHAIGMTSLPRALPPAG